MDPNTNRTIEIILTSLLGGGGLAALLTAVRSYRAKRRGLPGNEGAAIAQTNIAEHHTNLPDWEALNNYWRRELATKAREVERVRHALELQVEAERQHAKRRAQSDADHIDKLEAHIWQQLPPPPPTRERDKK